MTNPSLAPTPVQRLLSLDVLRGITIGFMIMVNNNGGPGSWGFMNHAVWNGLTATDLVFPTFVFVVGASVVFAFEARLARGATRAQLAVHTVQRAAILFLLGIVVNGFPLFELAHLRIYGVLQRIAVAYLVVGLFYLWDRRASTKVVALVVALVGYWVLLRWVPIPGAGMPGRDFPFMDQTQNLTSWLDRQLMPHHLYLDWPGPGIADPHNRHDPEGFLSDLPAVGTALLGMLAGLWLRTQRKVKVKVAGLAAFTLVCLGSGYLWSVWFPFNKNLWTSSFVLAAAGWSLTVFTLAFWAVEGPARQGIRLSLAGAGLERHRGLHVQRTGAERARTHSLCGRGQAKQRAGLDFQARFRAHSEPRMGGLCLLRVHAGVLLYPGVDSVSQEDFCEGVGGSCAPRSQKSDFVAGGPLTDPAARLSFANG
jgi:predicted acyltransferase